MCDAASLCHRRVQPVDDVALLHLAHIEEDVFAHLDVLAEGQIGHEQPPADGRLCAEKSPRRKIRDTPSCVSYFLVRVVIQNFLKKPVISTVFKADK